MFKSFRYALCVLIITQSLFSSGQKVDYYQNIPQLPDAYTSGNVLSRMVDGLGFRYYWATEGLRSTDLDFRPTTEARSSLETVEHIYDMVLFVAISVEADFDSSEVGAYPEVRNQTLALIQAISEQLAQASPDQISEYKADFGQGTTYPFWYFINGQLSDCIWHCGQIASFRRTSGNPINPNVRFYQGIGATE